MIALTLLGACKTTVTPVTATEDALCRAWGESLPTRSRNDTVQTQDEITDAIADFAAACPTHKHLI